MTAIDQMVHFLAQIGVGYEVDRFGWAWNMPNKSPEWTAECGGTEGLVNVTFKNLTPYRAAQIIEAAQHAGGAR